MFELFAGKSVGVVVSQDKNGTKLFKDLLQWEGIEFRAKGCGGRAVPFNKVLTKVSIARVALGEL